MLPLEFHELYPELWRMNPYCIAEIVNFLRNRKDIKFWMRNEEEHVHRPVSYGRKMPLQTPILDSAIDFSAQATGKTVGFIEKRPCLPIYRMPLAQVRECKNWPVALVDVLMQSLYSFTGA